MEINGERYVAYMDTNAHAVNFCVYVCPCAFRNIVPRKPQGMYDVEKKTHSFSVCVFLCIDELISEMWACWINEKAKLTCICPLKFIFHVFTFM